MLTHSLRGTSQISPDVCAALALSSVCLAPMSAAAAEAATRTPIKHVIIIIGENRTFITISSSTRRRQQGHRVDLLSQIIEADGTPGTEYDNARQSCKGWPDLRSLSWPPCTLQSIAAGAVGRPIDTLWLPSARHHDGNFVRNQREHRANQEVRKRIGRRLLQTC